MNQSRRSNCMLRSSNARNGCKALVFICDLLREKARLFSLQKVRYRSIWWFFRVERSRFSHTTEATYHIVMMSSNYVHHTERRPINGLFLYKRKQLTKKKEEKQQQQTDKQSNKTPGRSRGKQQFNSFRRTAVKRRLHEEEAFQSWETEGFSKYLQPKSDF